MYEIKVRGQARKQILRIPPPHFERIHTSIAALAQQPRPADAKKLSGQTGYRIRVGDYRVLYEIDDDANRVTVYRVKHRREVYRD
ncbi:MAG TPA: type II toxin-antitoxin system RelE/ParE family toxin [Chloroflexota bacterium]|nr:type II toxin-antitoxin system RelE/ParE family toxin [Chloroflexota bacterium]HUM71676.1 type II toxin-antitoxin system RelE/ParE family toxin [Chloroflexota bacterium]